MKLLKQYPGNVLHGYFNPTHRTRNGFSRGLSSGNVDNAGNPECKIAALMGYPSKAEACRGGLPFRFRWSGEQAMWNSCSNYQGVNGWKTGTTAPTVVNRAMSP